MKTTANLIFAALCGALLLATASAANAAEAPYGGTAAAVPGTVQAENYDTGGQGTAYNVTSTNGSDNGYRSDGVDLEVTTDTGGGVDLGWTTSGQWFRYTVNVATAGKYTVTFRVAAPAAAADAFHISNSSGTNLSGSVAVPATGGYQTWTSVTASVTLPAGTQTLTVNQDAAGWNLNWISFAAVSSGEAPYPGPAAAAVPGTVMAENYDAGGQGVAYNVTSTNGTANTYRTGGVDLEAATAPATGNDLGWSAAGQWFRYTVNASTAGTYSVSFLVASPTAVADAFHISNSAGTNLSGSVAVPATGGYQTWTTVKANVTLPAGTQTLTLSEDAAGWNIDSLAFAAGSSGCTAAPSAPTGLAASGTTSTGTNLAWTADTAPANCSISSYTVLKNGASIGTATGTSFAVTGLAASTNYSFTVEATDAAGTSAASSAVSVTTSAASGGEAPYPGPAAAAIPGTVMAENYDTGGQGVAYNVTSTNGTANTYRTGGVDLEAATAPATGNDLGWSAAGQWFRYTVNVSTAGTYTASFLVASPTAVGDAFHISNSSGANLTGSVAVPATGGYQTWTTVTANITLPAGTQTLTMNEDAAGWNIDSLGFASGGGGGCTTKPNAPTGLSASGITSTTTTLNWTADTAPANCSISSYTVLKNGASIGTATGTSFAVSGLTASTNYSFTVEATDAAGTSAASSAVSVTTSAPATGNGRVLVGYWHDWETPVWIQLRNVPTSWDIVVVAFANYNGNGQFSFTVDPDETQAQFISDVQYLHGLGKKVLISLGGASETPTLASASDASNFSSSVAAMINQFGFDGVDIDFENGAVYLNQGDFNLTNPSSPSVVYLISGLQQLHQAKPNAMVTMAPIANYVQAGYQFYGSGLNGASNWNGAQLPVINAIRGFLTYVWPQYYNEANIVGLDGNYYSEGSEDNLVAMSEMLLKGFTVADGAGTFQPLNANQVVIGVPASSSASAGYLPSSSLEAAFNYLTTGKNPVGSYVLRNSAGYPGVAGYMAWSINWDVYSNGGSFGSDMHTYLNSLSPIP